MANYSIFSKLLNIKYAVHSMEALQIKLCCDVSFIGCNSYFYNDLLINKFEGSFSAQVLAQGHVDG